MKDMKRVRHYIARGIVLAATADKVTYWHCVSIIFVHILRLRKYWVCINKQSETAALETGLSTVLFIIILNPWISGCITQITGAMWKKPRERIAKHWF